MLMRTPLKRRPTLGNYILVAFFLGAVYYLYRASVLLQQPEGQNGVVAMLATVALYFYFLLPAIFFLAIGLVVLSPFVLFLRWVIRRRPR